MTARFEVVRDCNVASRDYQAGDIIEPVGEVNVTTCVMCCKIGMLREVIADGGDPPPQPEPEPEPEPNPPGEGEGEGESRGPVQPVSSADGPVRRPSRK